MTTTSISIKTTKDLKEKLKKTADEQGVSLNGLVNGYLKKGLDTKSTTYHFHDEEPSEYLKKSIKQAEKDYKDGKASPAFDNATDAIAWLEKKGAL
jgi:antitoxin component of RelBE/YafQ-DinJ toxin-antitoxin module